MRLLNQMLKLSRIFDCFSRRFDKVVFNLKLPNLVDSNLVDLVGPCREMTLQKFIWTIDRTATDLKRMTVQFPPCSLGVFSSVGKNINTTWFIIISIVLG